MVYSHHGILCSTQDRCLTTHNMEEACKPNINKKKMSDTHKTLCTKWFHSYQVPKHKTNLCVRGQNTVSLAGVGRDSNFWVGASETTRQCAISLASCTVYTDLSILWKFTTVYIYFCSFQDITHKCTIYTLIIANLKNLRNQTCVYHHG